jgi:hypothetical protein
MAKVIRGVVVNRRFSVLANDDSTDDEIENALRAVVSKLGRAKVQALVAALGDGPGDEDDEDDEQIEANGGQVVENSTGLGPMRLFTAPPDKKSAERAQREVVSTNDGEPAVLGLTPGFLLAKKAGGKRGA